ncbi:DUF58 domain-containing protein [Methanococcoides methylutens]|uniref:DUF58 domain-containing protein n=1 Tax=Methanococcoides methylutens MM1 TaxID=1434104 RepID=A0A0E3SRM2_METMT|nr:DUF58 domain-containing protein [Methanococcoides methylutens]AKB84988.1 hypothetical protein MCMEM_0935 [Methanococcoides methylutens MM1]
MSDRKHRIDVDFFRQLDRFTFMVRKRVSSAYAGSRRSTHSGRGLDTLGYVEYHPGDDIKSIDWNVYARSEKLYVREFEEDKSVTTHILLDASNSMDYTSGEFTKYEYGAMLASGFAYLVTKDNDKFGISTYAEDITISQTHRGRRYLLRDIDRMADVELEGKTELNKCVEQYEKVIHSRSLVVIISDFMEDISSIESAIYRLSHHDLMLIQVLDPSESDLSMHGHVKLFDLETDDELKTYLSNNFKDKYQEELQAHIDGIRNICDHVGADFFTFTTDTPVFDAFFHTINGRKV